MINIIDVVRYLPSEKSTIGNMSFNGVFIANTLEDVVRPKGIKIYGATAIPEGNYEVTMHYWAKYDDYYPMLMNVPNFEGILIHAGVNQDHTEGCLLVGIYDKAVPDQISDSRLIYRKIVLPNIKNALNGGKLYINIRNEFPLV